MSHAKPRSLLRQPAYATLSILTLTLAVGANLMVFTIVKRHMDAAAAGTIRIEW